MFGLGHWPTGNGRSPWTRQSRSPIGHYVMATAEHREPCDSSYAAFIAAHSIIAAPIARHRGGFGQHIEVALFDAAFQVMGREAQIVNGVPAACERLPINRAIIKRDRCGATTGCSAPAPRFGTLALAVGAACALSLHVVSVTRHRFSRSIRKPGRASRRLHAGCRSGSIRASPELIPEEGSPPGSDIA